MFNVNVRTVTMGKLTMIGGYLLGLCALTACEKEIDAYSPESNFIYFDMPFVLNEYGIETSERVEKLSYSFELDDISVTSHTFKIPVNSMSLPVDHDRAYKVEVVKEETTATSEDWDADCLSHTVIKAGEVSDTLYVKVNRTKSLRTEWKDIAFQIVPNEEFDEGYYNLLKAKVTFSDQVVIPEWWPTWQRYFGEPYRETIVKWREIYHLGADPNVETIGGPGMGKPLYWDNMPYYAMEAWYPTTFMFIRVLKQYFIDNVVYPDGDTTKGRILLP